MEEKTCVEFVFDAVAWLFLCGGYDVIERRQGIAETAFEVASDVEDSFEERYFHLAFSWDVVDEESWVIANSCNA